VLGECVFGILFQQMRFVGLMWVRCVCMHAVLVTELVTALVTVLVPAYGLGHSCNVTVPADVFMYDI